MIPDIAFPETNRFSLCFEKRNDYLCHKCCYRNLTNDSIEVLISFVVNHVILYFMIDLNLT